MAASPLPTRAGALSYLGHNEAALADRKQAVEIRKSLGGGMMKDWFDAVETEIYLNAGQAKEAVELAKKVAAVARSAGTMVSLVRAERTWGVGLSRLGAELAEVEAHLQESLQIASSIGLLVEAIRSEIALAHVYRERGDLAAGGRGLIDCVEQPRKFSHALSAAVSSCSPSNRVATADASSPRSLSSSPPIAAGICRTRASPKCPRRKRAIWSVSEP